MEEKEELARMWDRLCAYPVPEEAFVTHTEVLLKVSRSHTAENKKTAALISITQTPHGVQQQPLPFVLGDGVSLCSPSPSGAYLAVFRNSTIEINDRLGLVRTIDTSTKYSQVLGTETFGGASWQPGERFLAFIAEPIVPECRAFWETSTEREKMAKKPDVQPPETRFQWREDWGEKHAAVCSPAIFVLEIATGAIRRLTPRFPEEDHPLHASVSIGQVQWARVGSQLAFVAWQNAPRRLGITYCSNRASSLWRVNFTTNDSELATRCSPEGIFSTVCPRVSPSGHNILVATTNSSKIHNCAYSIGILSPPSGQIAPIVGASAIPCDGVGTVAPQQCFPTENVAIFNTQVGFQRTAFVCQLDSGTCTKMPVPQGFERHSCIVLAACHGIVVASFSTPTTLPVIAVGKFEASGIQWEVLNPFGGVAAPEELSTMKWENLVITPEPGAIPRFPFEVLLCRQEKHKHPLVAMLHGGPHSANNSAFNTESAFFMLAGYNVLHVNYTGSSCAGDLEMARLAGRIGTVDVADCEDAIRTVLHMYASIDSSRVCLFGGSHAGFLIGHLITRSSLANGVRYCAAAVRNPVFNLATMFDTSDIPDWTLVESGAESSSEGPGRCATLFACSPACRFATSAPTVPTAIFLGTNDKRVPNEQGLALHRALLARGMQTELRVYPGESHSFVKPAHKGDCLVNSALWFTKHFAH